MVVFLEVAELRETSLGWQYRGRNQNLDLAMLRLNPTSDINIETPGTELHRVCSLENRAEVDMRIRKYVKPQCLQMAFRGPGSVSLL